MKFYKYYNDYTYTFKHKVALYAAFLFYCYTKMLVVFRGKRQLVESKFN